MSDHTQPPGDARRHAREAGRGFLTDLRIRKKLIVLHTSFSLVLAALLLVALRPALGKVIVHGEQAQAAAALEMLRSIGDSPGWPSEAAASDLARLAVRRGTAAQVGLTEAQAARLSGPDAAPVPLSASEDGAGVAAWFGPGELVVVRARNDEARRAVSLVYTLLIISLLAGYAFVAGALEMFVLPRHVYTPIRAMLDADDAVRRGDREAELIAPALIPADELGEIMRSRNESVASLRRHETELAAALGELERTAVDLHKKNHLLEAARRNLEGTDRLASLGMMSAGIAHELNTPLAVVKGLADKLAEGRDLSPAERALMARVVGRLETLSEGLLDFARVRPPRLAPADLHAVVSEAATLVRLDRTVVRPGAGVEIINAVPVGTELLCDADRMIQVFVNLVRNSAGVIADAGPAAGRVVVSAQEARREGEDWLSVTVADNGPGIPPEVVGRLFEPFASTRLDANGTGLGLAVSKGIVHEHGGLLVARNATPGDRREHPDLRGAVFEILLPRNPSGAPVVAV